MVSSAISAADVTQWDMSADVVVVGLGAAGACAAIEADACGARVLVLERAAGGGGASALSEGLFYLGGGTEVQTACGYADDPEQMYDFLKATMPNTDDKMLRSFCEGSTDHFKWLESHGVPFARRALDSKAVSSHTGEGLLTTGNESAYPFSELVAPIPRGHQTTATPGDHGGAVAMRALLAALAASEAEVVVNARVDHLVSDAGGRVRGLRVRLDGRDQFVEVARGVVITTGSFNLNAEMTSRHLPIVSKYAQPLGTPDNDGVGILLGESVGAATANMGGALVTSSIYPPEQLIKGVIVNNRGQRFTAEDVYHGRLGHYIAQQPDQQAYLVVDEETFAYPASGRHKLIGVWDTVAETEAELGLPTGALAAALSEYNRDVEDLGEDQRFHKRGRWLKTIHPPVAAFDLSFSNSGYNFIALGGLRIDEHGRVVNEAGDFVPGLYAAGACAAHLSQNGAEYASGLSLGPGSFFGRRAGRCAAAETTF
ncbi:FAD-dependent oxidoreductase [Mycolicibacterium sp. P9-22]|uniref:FAD-dependent oxidoreductase n=1 Tax=Mycolicibacterium sp. P9-22 TaxID=2024613 RepID=UPI0011EFE879|nr:FAD-dependent oxidoreductase [Mycolicibacterium sp. P9-22]KAA0120639.1 FAD-dependent oxidoreductase [Mycolicibacterium sp. P9-22]